MPHQPNPSKDTNTVIGAGAGAVLGAVVGGPIGAVAGALAGGLVGSMTGSQGRNPNPGYTVMPADGHGGPILGKEVWGPYDTLKSAKTFARIGATESRRFGRIVMRGDEVVRWYQRGGERIL